MLIATSLPMVLPKRIELESPLSAPSLPSRLSSLAFILEAKSPENRACTRQLEGVYHQMQASGLSQGHAKACESESSLRSRLSNLAFAYMSRRWQSSCKTRCKSSCIVTVGGGWRGGGGQPCPAPPRGSPGRSRSTTVGPAAPRRGHPPCLQRRNQRNRSSHRGLP